MQLRRIAAVLLPLFALIGCDHATKQAAKTTLEGQPPRQILGRVLDLRYAENTDIAFNLLRWIPETWRTPLLVVLGGGAILALAVALFRRHANRATTIALVLILAGALGNYLDRIVRGYVVDFIHVPRWPVFNVADILVTIGIALFAWASLRPRQAEAFSST
jgi:signal peptidase II